MIRNTHAKEEASSNDMFSTTRAISDNHVGRTGFRVIRMKTFVIDRGDSNRVDAVRISVKVALITARSAIAASKYEDRTLSTPPVVDTVDDGFLDEKTWTFHRLAVIRRSPATAVDGNILKTIVESRCLVYIRYRARKNANTCDLGLISYTYATGSVLPSSDLPSTASSVMIVEFFRCRETLVVIKIIRVICILDIWVRNIQLDTTCSTHKILCQIHAGIIQTIIHDRSYDAFAREPHLPNRCDVHHMFGVVVVDQMPLVSKSGVYDT
jgi:hypothetical protein